MRGIGDRSPAIQPQTWRLLQTAMLIHLPSRELPSRVHEQGNLCLVLSVSGTKGLRSQRRRITLMRRWKSRWRTGGIVPTLYLLSLLTSGCSSVPMPTAASAPTSPHEARPIVAVARMVKGVESFPQPPLTVSVSCPPDEQMLGGGFAASDVFEYDAHITASYPANPQTWTVEGNASSSFWLSAYAYCWRSPSLVGIQIAQGGHEVVCPAHTSVIGGGFQGLDRSHNVSFPSGNGWRSGATRTYALCATNTFSPAKIATIVFNVQSSSHGYMPGGANVTCPMGSVALSGGFNSGGDEILASTVGATFSTWTILAGGEGDVTGYGLCVSVRSGVP